MLTKTLKFDEDVLDILRTMKWEDEGRLGIITSGQLERGLYVRLNKALEAMGGKWNRKLGGHTFPTDPRGHVEGLINEGTLTVERDGFFETPPAVVERMLSLVPIPDEGMILEPSAGLGAIADNLPVDKERIICIEKNPDRCKALHDRGYPNVHCQDFLEFPTNLKVEAIYMNPPFEEGQDIEHVMHAYECLNDEAALVSVMSEGPFFRGDQKSINFRVWLERHNGYSTWLPKNSFKESGTGVNTRLVVLVKGDST